MTMSEKLFSKGKVAVEVFGKFETAVIISKSKMTESNLRYLNTCETLCNKIECTADVYEHKENKELFAVIDDIR